MKKQVNRREAEPVSPKKMLLDYILKNHGDKIRRYNSEELLFMFKKAEYALPLVQKLHEEDIGYNWSNKMVRIYL